MRLVVLVAILYAAPVALAQAKDCSDLSGLDKAQCVVDGGTKPKGPKPGTQTRTAEELEQLVE